MVALLVSTCGFFGFYAFTKELFSEREGVVAAFLYLLCPPVLFYNNQFIAETFLFSTAPLFYWTVLRALRPQARRWGWSLLAIFLAVVLLLLKQSGFLLLILALVLPFAGRAERARVRWKICLAHCALVGALILLAFLISKAVLPSAFNATRARFDRNWVFSLSELVRLPFAAWSANLRVVGDFIGTYYTWGVPLFLCPTVWIALRKRRQAELVLLAMAAVGGGVVTFLLRGFNEYLFNTAVVAVLLPLLARAGTHAWQIPPIGRAGLLRLGLLALAALTLAHWTYQIVLMRISPGGYVERSTPWSVHNHLRSWSTGFGLDEIVALLEHIPQRGVVLTDPQWGNPRTGLEVYAVRFSNLALLPITRKRLEDATQPNQARAESAVHLVIFSADASGDRPQWQEIVSRHLCAERVEVKGYPGQMPIIVCRF